jgi:hypothetical protein
MYDRTIAVSTEADLAILDQLPVQTQNKLLCEYLFIDFLRLFGPSYFKISKMKTQPDGSIMPNGQCMSMDD